MREARQAEAVNASDGERAWRLMHGEKLIAELVVTGGNFPWLNAHLRPAPEFEEVRARCACLPGGRRECPTDAPRPDPSRQAGEHGGERRGPRDILLTPPSVISQRRRHDAVRMRQVPYFCGML
jgi:hypothetical protein